MWFSNVNAYFFIVGGFLASVSQYWIDYHVTILFGLSLMCQCVFLPETLYPRAAILGGSVCAEGVSLKRTKQLGYLVSNSGSYHPTNMTALPSNPRGRPSQALELHSPVRQAVDVSDRLHQRLRLCLLSVLVVRNNSPNTCYRMPRG